jgi:rubrerythrin
MGVFFAKEIMGGAIQIERNGQSFYQQIAQQLEAPAMREVFEHLAREELRHIREFEGLAEHLAEPPDHWEREDFELYMDTLVSDHVFKDDGSGERKAREVRSDLEAVELGIQFEKDTIIFFNELNALVRSEERQVLDQLLRWEKDHLVRLVRLKRQLEDSKRQRSSTNTT